MRLWSLHPRYLDSRGLVALWREALLAQKVLAGKTNGYRHHPQLDRFREASAPMDAIAQYLEAVYEESAQRGYRFDHTKIGPISRTIQMKVTNGQIAFEAEHLRVKLSNRDPQRLVLLKKLPMVPHPLFVIVRGEKALWERA